MKKIYYLLFAVLFFTACEQMEDTHKDFQGSEETLYSSSPTAVIALPGINYVDFHLRVNGLFNVDIVSVKWKNGIKDTVVEIPIKTELIKDGMFKFTLDKLPSGPYAFTLSMKNNTTSSIEKKLSVFVESPENDSIYINAIRVRSLEPYAHFLSKGFTEIRFKSPEDSYLYTQFQYYQIGSDEVKELMIMNSQEFVEIKKLDFSKIMRVRTYQKPKAHFAKIYISQWDTLKPKHGIVDALNNIQLVPDSGAVAVKWMNAMLDKFTINATYTDTANVTKVVTISDTQIAKDSLFLEQISDTKRTVSFEIKDEAKNIYYATNSFVGDVLPPSQAVPEGLNYAAIKIHTVKGISNDWSSSPSGDQTGKDAKYCIIDGDQGTFWHGDEFQSGTKGHAELIFEFPKAQEFDSLVIYNRNDDRSKYWLTISYSNTDEADPISEKALQSYEVFYAPITVEGGNKRQVYAINHDNRKWKYMKFYFSGKWGKYAMPAEFQFIDVENEE